MILKILMSLAMTVAVTTHAIAAQEVRILRQPAQSSNMPLLYSAIEIFEKSSRQQGIPVSVVLQPMSNVSDGITSMLAGKTDIIVGAVIPLAFAQDKAPGRLQLLSGTASQGHDLICNNPEIKSVADIRPGHRIAMKTLGSSEHFFMRQVSKKFFGDYFALDKNIVTMPRPQIAALMTSRDKSIDCAVPGTPLQGSLVKSGSARLVFSSDQKEILGNIHGSFATTAWVRDNPRLAEIWIRSLKEAAMAMEQNPDAALLKFIEMDQVKDPLDVIKESMRQANQRHSVRPVGIGQQFRFLHEIGLLKNPPDAIDRLLWRPDLVQ